MLVRSKAFSANYSSTMKLLTGLLILTGLATSTTTAPTEAATNHRVLA